MSFKKAGFTIVELLIVVVVIGILAAITIVAYNGIQDRTNNTTTIDGVAKYTKLFQMYAVDNGTYPSTAVYPCLIADAAGGCGRISGSGGCAFSGVAPQTTAFYALLSPYANSMPTLSSQTMGCNGETYKGAYVNANSTNAKLLSMVVFLKGNTACPASLGAAEQYARSQIDQTTLCNYRMPTLP